jgi:serine protease Do
MTDEVPVPVPLTDAATVGGWSPAPAPSAGELLPPPPPPTSARRPAPDVRGRAAATSALVALVVGAASGWAAARLAVRDDRGAASQSGSIAVTADVPTVIATVEASVVTIDTTATATGRRGQSVTTQAAGTGFVFGANGIIATNAHVVSGATTVTVTFSDQSSSPGTVIGTDTVHDLAIIKVDRTGLVPLPLGSSAALRVGQSVIAIGNALALQGSPTASMGIVSALDRTVTASAEGTSAATTYENLVQTDASINPGDSGGPLIALDGTVVGIDTAGTTTAENIGFAIPIDVAAPILRRLAGS